MPTMSKLRKNIGKQFHLQQSQKKIKYLEVNLTKDVNNLYIENDKTLNNVIEEDRRWKDLPCSGIQNQHSKNGYTTKSNLYVQCNSHQNPNDIHHSD
jgi:hypothetical protein